MSGLQTNKAKKKRAHDDQTLKRVVKLDSASNAKKTIQFENTLSLPIQQALSKFREASEQELIRLKNEGMDSAAAINKLVEKMRTTDDDVPPCFTRQELELVMEIAGVNEEGATRALILKSELAKLRHDGFNHPEAINELSRRMKRLAGSKRRGTSTVDGVEGKHRRKGSISSSSRVAFAQLDALSPMHSLELPQHQSASRKRVPDALMLDEDGYTLLRKRHKYDRDLSDSEEGSEEEQYHFDDVGEFSQDEKELGREEGDSEDLNSPEDIIPLHTPYIDFSPSSSDEDVGFKGEEDLDDDEERDSSIHDWLGDRGMLFHAVKEEDSDSEDTWQLPSTHSHSHSYSHSRTPTQTTPPHTSSTTTNPTTAPTPTTFASLLPSFFASSPLSSPPTLTRTPTIIGPPKTTKRRDSPPSSSASTPSSSSSSSRVLSHRSLS